MAEQVQAGADRKSNLAVLAWIIYGILCWVGLWLAGSVGGFAAMVLIVLSEYRRGAVRIMDCTSLGYFAAAAIMAATPAIYVLQKYHLVIVWSAFAAVAWATLIAGFPFTIQYAREHAPPEAWPTPLFRQINVTLTLAWALIFTFGAILGAVTLVADHQFLLGVVLPTAAMVVGYIFSNRYPKRFADRFGPVAAPGATGEAAR